MGLFSKFSKKTEIGASKEQFLTVSSINKLTDKAVEIRFNIPEELKSSFQFIPGQYVNVHVEVNGKEEVRSYSICTSNAEGLGIGVKAVDGGKVSNYLVSEISEGQEIKVSKPQGKFQLPNEVKSIVGIVAGSGITPVLSMAKSLSSDQEMHLVYGNKSSDETMFYDELKTLAKVDTSFFFTRKPEEGSFAGRLDKQAISEYFKLHLNYLKADAFVICGPEEMIVGAIEVLTVFGIPKEKIHFELFTTPVLMKSEESVFEGSFEGDSQVSAILDGEITRVTLSTKGKSVLDALDNAGMDAPYSCKGGVCCSCRAKIVEGSARMVNNFGLTDEEVRQGYILTCQAHPTSEVLKLDFDA